MPQQSDVHSAGFLARGGRAPRTRRDSGRQHGKAARRPHTRANAYWPQSLNRGQRINHRTYRDISALSSSQYPHNRRISYSHSIVAGGFGVTSYTTRFTPGTSATIREEILPITSYGSFAQSAVMASELSTARTITGRA